MELDDFKQDTGLKVEDLKPEDPKGVSISTASSAQIAAMDTMMSPDTSLDEFRKTKEDLLSSEGRERFLLKHHMLRKRIVEDARKELPNILTDEGLSEDEKRSYVESIQNYNETYTPNAIQTFAEESLLADMEEETEETFASRQEMIDIVGSVNDHKKQVAQAINALMIKKSGGTLSTIVDFGELITPFAEWFAVRDVADDSDTHKGGLLGRQKAKIYDKIRSMPMSERAAFTENLLQAIDEDSTVVFSDGNALFAVETLSRMTLNNDYSNIEKWFDNATSVLDAFGVGAIIRAVGKTGKAAKLAEQAKAIATRSEVKADSPAQILADTNPEKARNSHRVVAADETEEAAEALYGSTREEALAKDLLPEPEIEAGKAPVKVKHDGPEFEEPLELRDARERDGNLYLTEQEFERANTAILKGLEDVEGMIPHRESMVVKTLDDGRTNFRMMYRPKDSGFKTVTRAVENALYAFRNYGISESDLTLYYRSPEGYVETTMKELAGRKALRDEFTKKKKKIPADLKEIDYAVGIDYTFRPTIDDVDGVEKLLSKRNFFDRLPPGLAKLGQGSLNQHLFDASSTIHPQIVESAAVAVDRGTGLRKLYVDTFDNFTQTYRKLPKERRAAMTEYINEANFNGLRFDELDLRNRGFNDKEVGALKEWRRANDAMWHATNADLVKTLKNRGFVKYVDKNSDTELMVQPVLRGGANSSQSVYDSVSDSVKSMTKDEIDDLYDMGGYFAKLHEPIDVGQDVSMVLVRNTPESGYTRVLRDDEAVLAYRDGYYPVMYDANFFIDVELRAKGGELVTKTIASSKTKSDVEHMLKQMQATNPDSKFTVRQDRRTNVEKANGVGIDSYSVGVSSGLSTQRVRGKRLADVTGGLWKVGQSNLHDPLEAVSFQINQLSQKVSMRNWMENTKKRWLENYFDDLKLDTDKSGRKKFPASITDIVGKDGVSPSTVAQARTLFNYIHTLENGYINGIDEGYKALINMFADELSNAKFPKIEGVVRDAKNANLTSNSKSAVFKLFLASNPVRQLIIQMHQNIQLNAINPKYILGPGLATDYWELGKALRGIGSAKGNKLLKEIRQSGFLEAVDANNLIRQDLLRLADTTYAQKAASIAGKPINLAQRVGFDFAEQNVLIASWLAHRDLAVRAGTKLDRRAYDEIAGKARAFTYNMNRAGDMPYNQNSLNIIAQFLQVPHKALLQPLTNRSLTRKQRTNLFMFNTLMYGVPAGLVGTVLANMPEGESREVLTRGLEDVMLNHLLTNISGEQQNVDFGDLAPSDLHGMGDFIAGMLTTSPGALFAESPVGSLVMGANPRFVNLAKTVGRYTHVIDDYEDPELNTKFTDVAIAFSNLFSGASNAFKARYAYETRQKVSSLGNVNDTEITALEAAFQVAGFSTRDQVARRRMNEMIYGSSYEPSDSDVDLWYDELKRHLTRRGQSVREADIQRRVLSEAWRVFGLDEGKARQRIANRLTKDAQNGDFKVIQGIKRQLGVMSNKDVREIIEGFEDGPLKDNLRMNLENLENLQQEAREIG